MRIARSVSRLAICLPVAVAALVISTTGAKAQPAGGNFRLVLPDGPFQQWTTITFGINSISNGSDSAALTPTGIDVLITTPSGMRFAVPTFHNSVDASENRLTCRFTPREVGEYTATINGTRQKGPGGNTVRFEVSKSANGHGFLQIDRRQPNFMLFDNGEQFRGIGTNIGWEPRRRRNNKYTYDTLFPRIADQGLNTVRTWMCPWNMPVEWNSRHLGEYDQEALKRLDEMFALAEKNGIYVVLVLGYHGELQTESGSFPNNDRWKENPYNVVHGGPCATPAEFFTNEQAKALYKKRLRLLVARVACHPHLLAWEFWNEIDHIERRGPVPGDAIVSWHEEMADYLRSIDPYEHPITTSISVKAPPGLWETEDLDLIMLHPYGSTAKLTKLLTEVSARYDKPAIAGEFSFSWKPARENEEQDFENELRLGLWRGLMSPTPVLPMTWWWEFHDSRGDWRYFRPVSKFSKRMIELNHSEWRPIQLKSANDSIECHGIAIGRTLFLWIHNRNDTTASNVAVVMQIAQGENYESRQFNTLTGELVGEESVSLRADDEALTLSIPSLEGRQDTAFILSR